MSEDEAVVASWYQRYSPCSFQLHSHRGPLLVAALLTLPISVYAAPLALPVQTTISSVQFSGEPGNYTLGIEGAGFGAPVVRLPFTGGLPNFRIGDKARTSEWGYIGDSRSLKFLSWSDTKIVVSGFTGQMGDAVIVTVWNAKSGAAAAWGGNVRVGPVVHSSQLSVSIAGPLIHWVRFSGTGRKVRIVVSGSGFGPAPSDLPARGVSGRSRYFNFQDFRAHCGVGSTLFNAGGDHWGIVDPDPVALVYESWSDTQIVISGFGDGYGTDCATYQPGDPVAIAVWNSRDTDVTGPQTAWGGAGDSPQVAVGQTQDEVIAILGQPDQIVDLGTNVIYAYGSRRITFTGGRVTDLGTESKDVSQQTPPPNPPGHENVVNADLRCSGSSSSGVDDQIHGSVRILGGSGTFASLSSSDKVLTVYPGERLLGSVRLEATNGGKSDAVAPLIGTVSWGDPSHAFWTIATWVQPGTQNLNAQVQLTAPTTPGTYHIFFAMQLELSAADVASGTNWALRRVVWGDGNDIAGFSFAQIAAAQQDGCTVDQWLTTSGYEPTAVPADAITLNVK